MRRLREVTVTVTIFVPVYEKQNGNSNALMLSVANSDVTHRKL